MTDYVTVWRAGQIETSRKSRVPAIGRCPRRKSDPEIMMVQIAEKRRRCDGADGFYGPSCWRILIQS
jgi:hypothetical protein